MEQKPKKREWVKNAAIIFLAVMLVLTFFSNTILNRTLPEVVTRYVEPGTIDAKVRISGTVAARENYDVIIDQTRKVAAVNVRVGQEVSTGDLLFTLEPGDSAELEAARKELQQLQIDYQRALLNATDADYAKENRDIELARAALEKAVVKRDSLALAPNAIELDALSKSQGRSRGGDHNEGRERLYRPIGGGPVRLRPLCRSHRQQLRRRKQLWPCYLS